ncbi:hypothetical protein NC652_002015 [Populus alba x Populus x berolinensis]|nr:hypothetical protein NC652_002015 [Populus alba x Populus x berolinensis]
MLMYFLMIRKQGFFITLVLYSTMSKHEQTHFFICIRCVFLFKIEGLPSSPITFDSCSKSL